MSSDVRCFLAAMTRIYRFLPSSVLSRQQMVYPWLVPEGPECRRAADWLKSNTMDCVVRDVEQSGRFVKQPIARVGELKNKRVTSVRCRGKVIVLDFEGDLSAISTLGMTGRWTRSPGNHTALTLWCERPPTRGILPVYYDDQRRFGNFRVVATREATSKLDELGWDALAEPGTSGKARQRAMKYALKPISEVLLLQDVFAGVGNYIRAEAMYRARVHPERLLINMPSKVWNPLCSAIVDVMRESYSRGGATLENFYGGDGERGDQVDFLEVYGRITDPNGRAVARRKDKSGRTVWWVPEVQGGNE
jgi:formamidopyrimidine-DNA glycosylase